MQYHGIATGGAIPKQKIQQMRELATVQHAGNSRPLLRKGLAVGQFELHATSSNTTPKSDHTTPRRFQKKPDKPERNGPKAMRGPSNTTGDAKQMEIIQQARELDKVQHVTGLRPVASRPLLKKGLAVGQYELHAMTKPQTAVISSTVGAQPKSQRTNDFATVLHVSAGPVSRPLLKKGLVVSGQFELHGTSNTSSPKSGLRPSSSVSTQLKRQFSRKLSQKINHSFEILDDEAFPFPFRNKIVSGGFPNLYVVFVVLFIMCCKGMDLFINYSINVEYL